MTTSIKKWAKTPYSFTCKFCGHNFSSMEKKDMSTARRIHYGKYEAGTKGGYKKHRRQRCSLIEYKPGRHARPLLVKSLLASSIAKSVKKIKKLGGEVECKN